MDMTMFVLMIIFDCIFLFYSGLILSAAFLRKRNRGGTAIQILGIVFAWTGTGAAIAAISIAAKAMAKKHAKKIVAGW